MIGLTVAAFAQRPDYEGPTILSRGLGPILGGGGEQVRIRPYFGLSGVYDSGLTPVSVDSEGKIPEDDAYGVEASFGAYGYHTWRRTVLGLDYRGNARHYSRNTYFDGSDHQLTLGVTHQASRRWVFSLRESAGTFSRNFGLLSGYGFFDPYLPHTPANELFDGRTYYASTNGDLTFHKSPRLSFNMGGTGLLVRRRSSALVGVTGWLARGDVAWRVNRSNIIGADYAFTHYEFTNAFGASDFHTVAYDWSLEFARRWQLKLRAGGSRVETLGLRYVAVDPVIAAIIGQSTGIEAFYVVNYVPTGDLRISRSFERSTVALSYSRAVDPGNGFYLTSRRDGAEFSYSRTARRRWNFGVSGGYFAYSSLGQRLGRYQSFEGGGGFTCQVARALHLVARFDTRRYEVQNTSLKRTHLRGSVGFTVSPGDIPLSLW
jgi:hypothetical protein